MSISNRKVKPKAGKTMDLLCSMLWHPGQNSGSYHSRNPNYKLLRRLVVKGHRVDWEDRPEAPGDVEQFQDGPNGMDGYLSWLYRRQFHTDWPPIEWKAFKKLVRRGYLKEVWPGFWAITKEGIRAAEEYRDRHYFTRTTFTSHQPIKSQYRRHKKRQICRGLHDEPPTKEEWTLFARGYVSKALAKYAERVGSKRNIRFAFDCADTDFPKDRDFRYRKGWAKRIAQRNLDQKYQHVEG